MGIAIRLLICFGLLGWVLASNANAGPLDSPGATKALICSACHGFGGNSPGNTIPIIAGMAPSYFKKAIKEYAEGKRPSPEMKPYSKYVLQAGIDDIADYFAVQPKQSPKTKSDPEAIKRGGALAAQCTACHGSGGEGDAFRAIPAINGQTPGYMQAQMEILKEDKRKLEDPALEDAKKKLLKALNSRQIADLAAYYSSLR
jgi:cytochrome c553